MSIDSVAKLVRKARKSLSQEEFAKELGVRQSSVSRYENGNANPPVKVIEHCMRIVHAEDTEPTPTAEELAAKVLDELAKSEHGEVRLVLAKLIDTLGTEHGQARGVSPLSR